MPPSTTRNYLQDKGYNAAAAMTKFRAVKFSAVETVTPVTGAADLVGGVVQHDVTAAEIIRGKGASIAVEGDTLMEASAAIVTGVRVAITADGRAVTAVATNMVHGRCIEPAAAAGDFVRVHLSLNDHVMA